ncbi:MAG: adenylate/guanylate cyclase domain-containing protein, partial [Anaerolineae bacterium]|nr:adenylate/guanylate cyclase domain-containing protein [Anaerolineae bacterium]
MEPSEIDRKDWSQLDQNDRWEIYLTEGFPGIAKRAPFNIRLAIKLLTSGFRILPAAHRCRWCYAPFQGFGAPLMHAIGRGPSGFNHNLCLDCENRMRRNLGGAEVTVTMLFADIRGSTDIAEDIGPTEYSRLIDKFYVEATDVLMRSDGFVDRLVGDEVVAYFVSGLGGEFHARRAVEAALGILAATGHGDAGGPWVPVGIGVQTGIAYIGTVGESQKVTEITVLGDVPNTASRLASSAQAGQIVISDDVARETNLNTTSLEMKELALKGKKEPVTAWTIE